MDPLVEKPLAQSSRKIQITKSVRRGLGRSQKIRTRRRQGGGDQHKVGRKVRALTVQGVIERSDMCGSHRMRRRTLNVGR